MSNNQQPPQQQAPTTQQVPVMPPPQQLSQQPHTPSGGASTAHPRNNYNNNNSNNSGNSASTNRHHYGNNNGGKPYRKNYNKDGQYQQAPAPYSPFYPQVVYGYPQQQYYYGVAMQQPYDQYQTNPGYYPVPQNYPSDQHLTHKATLTDKSGNRIQLNKPTHSRLPSTASSINTLTVASTPVQADAIPVVLPNTPVQPSKVVTPASVPASIVSPVKTISDSEKKARNEEFKAKIAARAAALLKLKEEKAKLEGSTTVQEKAPATAKVETKELTPVKVEESVKVEEPVEEEPKKVAEPVKEEPTKVIGEAEVEPEKPTAVEVETKNEEVVLKAVPEAAAPAPVVSPLVDTEDVKVEDPEQTKEESVKTEEPVAEAVTTSKEEFKEETKEEAKEQEQEQQQEEVAPVSETIPEEKTEPEAPSFTISNLFNLLRFARPVNPYTHTYPSTITPPDARLSGSKKIKYDPIFLIQFQQPLSLPRDDEWDSKYGAKIVLSDPRQGAKGNNDRSFSRNSSSQFGKGFIGNGPVQMRSSATNLRNDFNSRSGSRQNSKRSGRNPKEKSSRQKQGSRRDGNNRSQEEEKSEPTEPVLPLVKSESRWVPRSRVKALEEVKTAPDGSIILSEEDVNRKVKSLLNKLTLELFDLISAEIIAIANQSKWEDDGKTLNTVIELTFAKACDEPHWSSVYAKLCTKMFTDISPDVKDKTIPEVSGKPALSGPLLFRKYLLTRCQIEYEKGWTDKLPTNEDGSPLEPEMMSDEYYKLAAAKRRGLGLVRFIGELYSLSLLSEKIIVQCISGLVSNIEDPSEDVLENLVQLLNTVGPLLDGSRNQNFIEFMNSVFERINKIVETNKMSSRIKFKMMDLIDLRSKKWRGKQGDQGPKTLTEIHTEAERKRLEDERTLNDRRQNSRRGGQDSRSNSNRGGNSNQNLASQWGSSNRVSQNEIKSVGTIRNSNRFGPMNNFKDSKSSSINNINNNTNNTNNLNNDNGSTSSNNMRTPSSSSLRSQQVASSASPATQGQNSPSITAQSPLGLSTRESSKREAGNMFAALEDHDDEEESEEEEEDEDEEEDEEEEVEKDEQVTEKEDVTTAE